MVELLEDLNKKLVPVSAIALSLASKYGLESEVEEKRNDDPFENLPNGTQIKTFKGRKVAFLPDGSVYAETTMGPKEFRSFEEYRDFIGE